MGLARYGWKELDELFPTHVSDYTVSRVDPELFTNQDSDVTITSSYTTVGEYGIVGNGVPRRAQ